MAADLKEDKEIAASPPIIPGARFPIFDPEHRHGLKVA
jgi:hypothetical protein